MIYSKKLLLIHTLSFTIVTMICPTTVPHLPNLDAVIARLNANHAALFAQLQAKLAAIKLSHTHETNPIFQTQSNSHNQMRSPRPDVSLAGVVIPTTCTGAQQASPCAPNAVFGTITVNGDECLKGNLILQETTGGPNSVGNILKGDCISNVLFLHNFGIQSTFLGEAAGQFSVLNNMQNGNCTALGFAALSNAQGSLDNTALGAFTLANTTASQRNSAFGSTSLFENLTGSDNCAFGFQSLFSNTIGINNSAFGSGALFSNIGSSGFNGNDNSAFGFSSLNANTTGFENCAFGSNSLLHNIDGSDNCAFGYQALEQNIIGGNNCAFGTDALFSNNGANNSAFGASAMDDHVTGDSNTALGSSAMFFGANGFNQTAAGAFALSSFDSTDQEGPNAAFGYFALSSNVAGIGNAVVGGMALETATSGDFNAVVGFSAFSVSNAASRNSGVGALVAPLCNGTDNVLLGFAAGNSYFGVESGNIIIGSGQLGTTGESGIIRIGSLEVPTTDCFIAGIFGATVGAGALPVIVDSTGKLGTVVSALRYKEQIEDLKNIDDAFMLLRPVTFKHKKSHERSYGLIAEELLGTAFADLVVYNKDGQVEGIKYQEFDAILIKKIQSQQLEIDELKEMVMQMKREIQELRRS